MFLASSRKNLSLSARRRRRFLVKVSFVFFSIAIFAIGGVLVLNLSNLRISSIEVEGENGTISKEAITASIEKKLSGRFGFIVPRSSFLFYPRARITTDLLREFPALKKVMIETRDPNFLSVFVEEREQSSLWCPGEFSLYWPATESECYFLDETGFIFATAPKFSVGSYPVFGGVISTPTEPVGSAFLEEDQFREIQYFLATLPAFGFEPISIYAESEEFRLKVRGGMEILIPSRNLSAVLEDLRLIVSDKILPGSPGRVADTLKYLDLRFGDRVYYK